MTIELKQPLTRFIKLAISIWMMAGMGCAAIRKLNPLQSNVVEARRLTRQAETAMHKQSWEEAEQKLVSAIECCPGDDHARNCLAEVLWQRGAKRAAIEQLKKSIRLAGRIEPYVLTKLGNMELTEGLVDNALQHADEALEVDRSYADAWKLRGHAKNSMDDPSGALDCFFRSLSIQPEDITTRLQIADIYYQQGRSQRALALLDGASLQNVDSALAADAYLLRGLVLRDLGRTQEAATSLELAHDAGQPTPAVLFHLANAQLALGKFELARVAAEKALAEGDASERPALLDLVRRIDVALGLTPENTRR